MVHDIHAHCIPKSFQTWVTDSGDAHGAVLVDSTRGRCVRFADSYTTGPLRSDLTDRGERLEAMDRMGIDVQVLSGWIDLTGYHLPASGADVYSRAHNDCLAEEAGSHPDRFRALATVPLQAPEAATRELSRVMDEHDMVGAQIATTVGDRWLHQVDLDVFWEAAEDLEALIVLHPMAPLTGIDLSDYFMSNSVGRPAESTIALSGLIYSGVFERFPSLRICIVHGGGFTPFQIGRLDRGYTVKPDLTAKAIDRPPSAYLRGLYVDTVVHQPAVLRFLVDLLGADHILLGTDYPFEMGDPDPIGSIASAGLGKEQADMILSGNAERLFGSGRSG